MKSYPNVEAYLQDAREWQKEMMKLHDIVCSFDLDVAIKWGKPCYSIEKGNIAIIQPFKNYCALMFFKGALLEDSNNYLVQMTENTQAARQLRFTSLSEIEKSQEIIKEFISKAIDVEEEGKQVKFKETEEFEIPVEFEEKLHENPDLRAAFEALTPGRQKGYLLYFSGAKQSKTRISRIEKYIPRIFEGKGFRDR